MSKSKVKKLYYFSDGLKMGRFLDGIRKRRRWRRSFCLTKRRIINPVKFSSSDWVHCYSVLRFKSKQNESSISNSTFSVVNCGG